MSSAEEFEINDLIIGDSESMADIKSMVATYSKSDASVLIGGDTGTGKELVSKAIHLNSHRKHKPFQAINCGAIPAQFLESELFGHKKGAFTGSISDRKGRFELADQGTLFLDEIGDMPLELQVKLLRVLEDKVVQPLGGGEAKVDVRIVAATHRKLEEMMSQGKFREDLFYRINVLPIKIPSLCQRTNDIPILIEHLAKKFSNQKKPISFTPESLDVLQHHKWPGNVRELANFVHRFTTLLPESQIDLFSINTQFLDTEIRLLIANRANTEQSSFDFLSYKESANEVVVNNKINQRKLVSNNVEADRKKFEMDDFEDIIALSENLEFIPEKGIHAKNILNKLEEEFIKKALIQTSGNVSKASKLLCLGRTTLIQKIEKYNIRY
ncbi:sigma-54 dependent transcriptional regulator [Gammaproteobacteria bacterium]|nr:sigma-54 dependent transcriptional regulator [Gammaproteobacteria bacterium]